MGDRLASTSGQMNLGLMNSARVPVLFAASCLRPPPRPFFPLLQAGLGNLDPGDGQVREVHDGDGPWIGTEQGAGIEH